VNGSAEQVFDAWVTPDRMAEWYAPTDEFKPTEAEVDPEIGGRYRVAMFPPGQDQPVVVTGQYCRMDRPRQLSFTWSWISPRPDIHETQVTLDFQPDGAATNVVLTHERFRDQEQRIRHTEGWTGCLERLARKIGV
jgi:uncharacterized protein YndB with AHSA1/START domain